MRWSGVLLVLMTIGQPAIGVIRPLQPLPEELHKYLDIYYGTGNLTQNEGELMFWTCIQQYVAKFAANQPGMGPGDAELLSRTVYDIMEPVIGNHSRYKRQASSVRVRREIRAMSVAERRNYFAALNAAKRDTRLRPNVYDVLAGIHSAEIQWTAHFGPAFPSWHRMYLYIVESVLRRWYDPRVTIPYWASVFDNEMAQSTQSVIWSDAFFGNGFGIVNRGPFADWSRIAPWSAIVRRIGSGSLYSFAGIRGILSRRRNADILLPTALPGSNFEGQHAGPHTYVGGTMLSIPRAAFDPVFFSHHAFVDQIWERFRRQQQEVGINPETDYPYNPTDNRFLRQHHPDATAGFPQVGDFTIFGIPLARLTQRVGYWNQFSQEVLYEDLPSCPNCGNSPYLFCEFDRCVSRTINEMAGSIFVQDFGLSSLGEQNSTGPYISGSDHHERRTSHGTLAGKPPPPPPVHENVGCPRYSGVYDVNTNHLGQSSDQWAYIPVKVVSKRPSAMNKFNAYNLYDDVYPAHERNELTSVCKQKCYDNCKSDNDAVGKIKIVSYGLNHDGYSEDVVIVDNRLGVSEGNGYLPVKRPSRSEDSEVIVAAFDSCGRVCKPFCNLPGCDRLNKKYNGGLSLSSRFPEQYYNSYEEATLGVWKTRDSCAPAYDDGAVPITFFCEYGDSWIWEKYVPPRNQHPVTKRPARNYPEPRSRNYNTGNAAPNYSPQSSSGFERQQVPSADTMAGITTFSDLERLASETVGSRFPQNHPPGNLPSHQARSSKRNPGNGGRGEYCQVSPDCLIHVPCRGCADYDIETCDGAVYITICLNGKFTVATTVASYRKHFYPSSSRKSD